MSARGKGTLWLTLALAGCESGPDRTPATQAPVQAPPAQAATAVAPEPPLVEKDGTVHEHTGGARRGDTVPLVVAIHGLGDRPEWIQRLFRGFPVRAHLVFPAGDIAWKEGRGWWPIPGRIEAEDMAPGLDAATERLIGKVRVWASSGVAGKPIVTGFSQGGMLSFAIGVKYPGDVAEVIPMGGLLPPSMVPVAWPAGAPRPPFTVMHGETDDIVSPAFARRSAGDLRALGLRVEWKLYPGLAHWIREDMRDDLFAALGAAVDRAARGSKVTVSLQSSGQASSEAPAR